MRTPEFFEKKAICAFLDTIEGCWYYKPHMAGFGPSGVPDIIACINGRFVGIEVKRDNKVPTKIQDRRMHDITKASGLAIWGTSTKVIYELRVWLER